MSHGEIIHATCCTVHCTSVHTWQRACLTMQQSRKLLEIIAEWFLQLVSQRFQPLQGMSHCAMYRAPIARQVVRNIAQCDSALTIEHFLTLLEKSDAILYLESSSLVIFCVYPGSERQLIDENLCCFCKQHRGLK